MWLIGIIGLTYVVYALYKKRRQSDAQKCWDVEACRIKWQSCSDAINSLSEDLGRPLTYWESYYYRQLCCGDNQPIEMPFLAFDLVEDWRKRHGENVLSWYEANKGGLRLGPATTARVEKLLCGESHQTGGN